MVLWYNCEGASRLHLLEIAAESSVAQFPPLQFPPLTSQYVSAQEVRLLFWLLLMMLLLLAFIFSCLSLAVGEIVIFSNQAMSSKICKGILYVGKQKLLLSMYSSTGA